jgi:peptidoglycan/xylan/chitin deacetylase (PgdA/CDA1 family)
MIEFRILHDAHAELKHSPLLRAALLTLQYTQDQGAIGLTQTKAFKRVFVHWAVEHFDWPGSGAEEMFRYNKVINEYEFPPLEVLHYLLITLRLGRHFKGEFRLTKRGADLAQAPA